MPFNLYPWQLKALAAWESAKRRGMIEAVTGSGKTQVGLGAIAKLYAENKRLSTLVVVPSIVLMEQWHKLLRAAFPDAPVGRIGGGHNDDFSMIPIACVGVVNSVVRKLDWLLEHCRFQKNSSFLIADECHHYVDAPEWSRIREFPFDCTLGLSATLFPYEVPGLGSIVYEYGFGDACKDGIVPPFDLVNVTVEFTRFEREEYFDLSAAIGRQLGEIRKRFRQQLEHVPEHLFYKILHRFMILPGGGEDPTIKRLFDLIFKRAKIVYMAERKMRLAAQLTRMLVDQGLKKLLVFFERIQSADDVGEEIEYSAATKMHRMLRQDDPIWCRVYHSKLSGTARASVLAEFRHVQASALLACRSLDEGIDIPEVDAAILASSTQSLRQRVQRIGRTLRKGNGTKRPLVITLCVRGTTDAIVTADDHKTFAGVATIYEATEQSCVSRVRQLMEGHHVS